MTGQTISHYRIVEKLGEGGMGVVYKAEDTKLERTVALKFLAAHLLNDQEAKQRFLREAKSAAALHHPNICTVYEVGEADGKTFLAMAFLDGETLEDRIARGPLPLKDALDIGRQVAEGLAAAHAAGVVHRDIKPANILVSPEGRATILDFGLARLTEASKLTQADQTLGTAAYMSPEQMQGGEVDHRTDVWALGCVLYEMVAGTRPFPGEYEQALAFEVVNEDPNPLTAVRAGVPMELEFIVGKCLAKEAGERYQNAKDLSLDLRNLHKRLDSGQLIHGASQSAAAIGVTRVDEQPSSTRTLRVYQGLLVASLLAAVAMGTIANGDEAQDLPVRKFSFETGRLDTGPAVGRAVISPDGNHIVYSREEETTKLWVRDLSSEQPRPLDGTEGAILPFWSPDSKLIGFGTARYGGRDGDLKKVPIEGGAPAIVCSIGADYFGGAWSSDGESIVFSHGNQWAFYQVPARGGQPERLVVEGAKGIDHAFGPSLVGRKSGKDVLIYSTIFDSRIRIFDFETGKQVDLWRGSRPAYSPTGHLVFQTGHLAEGTWALPFSIETLEPTGTAFPLSDSLTEPSVSRDGVLISVGGRRKSRLVWKDRAGRTVGTIGPPQAGLDYPSLSPDGASVAAKTFEEGIAESDIWIFRVADDVRLRLTVDPQQDSRPIWSPSGDRVAFATHRLGNYDIFARGVGTGGEARSLTKNPLREGPSDWVNGGRTLLLDRTDPNAGDDLWAIELNGDAISEKPFLQTRFAERNPKLSPNGRFVAYQSDESGRYEVYVMPFPEGGERWPISTNGGDDPRWSRDGKELFYVEGATLVSVPVEAEPEFSAGQPKRLFSDISLQFGNYPNYDVSPDGQRFVMVERIDVEPPRIHVVENWYEEFRDREQE